MRLTSYRSSTCGCAFSGADPGIVISGSGEGGNPVQIERVNIGRGSTGYWSMTRSGTLYWDDSGRKMFRRMPFRIAGAAAANTFFEETSVRYTLGGNDFQEAPANSELFVDPEFAPLFSEFQASHGRITLDESIYDDTVALIWEIQSVSFAQQNPDIRIHSTVNNRRMDMGIGRYADSFFTPDDGSNFGTDILTSDIDPGSVSGARDGTIGLGANRPLSRGQGFVSTAARWITTLYHSGSETFESNPMGHSYDFVYVTHNDANFIDFPPRPTWRMEVSGLLTAVPTEPGS